MASRRIKCRVHSNIRDLLGRRLRRKCSGQTLVEYGLIIAVIAVVAIAVLVTLGGQTKSLYCAMTSQISRGAGS